MTPQNDLNTKPDKYSSQQEYGAISPMNMDVKILNTIATI